MAGSQGQDWAAYQVSAPSTSGIAFAFIKATEGTTYVSPKHADQVAHARAKGLVVGHYHFQRPGSPTAQAAYFLQHAGAQSGDVLACDWEDTGVSSDDKDAFIKAVQKAKPGLRALLYCNRDFWLNRDNTSFCGDGLWIADPSAPMGKPRVTAPWLFHQYSSTGGIDRNYSPMTAAQLHTWASKETNVATLDADDKKWLTTQFASLPKAVLAYDGVPASRPPHANDDYKTNPTWTVQYALQAGVEAARTACDPAPVALTDAQVAVIGQQLAAAPGFVAAFADAVAKNLAARLES